MATTPIDLIHSVSSLPRVWRMLGLACVLGGCATTAQTTATMPGEALAALPMHSSVRAWSDGTPEELAVLGIGPPPPGRRLKYLAISGGGSGGAFAAGILAGWIKHGDRPKFDIVSGVSTGALIAPFAFLGSAYDGQLQYGYTGGVTGDLL